MFGAYNPTHSIAATGPIAQSITAQHDAANSPCGPGTPYEQLIKSSAVVLFLGVSLNRNTLFHTVETLANLPYSLEDEPTEFTISGQNGEKQNQQFRLHRQGIPRLFAEQEEWLAENSVIRFGSVGNASAILMDASRFHAKMMEKLAANPSALRDKTCAES